MIPIPSKRLASALNLKQRELVALVGGGGKSTLLFQLARSLNRRTIVTTTTKMGERQTGMLDVIEAPFTRPLELRSGMSPVFVRAGVKDGKSIGVRPSVCDTWFSDHSLCDVVLVEADGAHHRPFKAPANFEPVLPDQTTTVLAVIGAESGGHGPEVGCPVQHPLLGAVAQDPGGRAEQGDVPAAGTGFALEARLDDAHAAKHTLDACSPTTTPRLSRTRFDPFFHRF